MIPAELYRGATEVAAAENVSVDGLFAPVFEERLLEFERLKETLHVEATRNSCALCRRFPPWNRQSMTASDAVAQSPN